MARCQNHYYNIELSYPSKYANSVHTEYPSGVVNGPGFFNSKDGISGNVYLLNQGCSSALTGTDNMQELSGTEGKTIWGRFVDSEMAVAGSWPEALCRRPPHHGNCAGHSEPFEYCNDGSRVYALCSEKDGKTVVICLTQMTDDPDIAKKIFESFRWTE